MTAFLKYLSRVVIFALLSFALIFFTLIVIQVLLGYVAPQMALLIMVYLMYPGEVINYFPGGIYSVSLFPAFFYPLIYVHLLDALYPERKFYPKLGKTLFISFWIIFSWFFVLVFSILVVPITYVFVPFYLPAIWYGYKAFKSKGGFDSLISNFGSW